MPAKTLFFGLIAIAFLAHSKVIAAPDSSANSGANNSVQAQNQMPPEAPDFASGGAHREDLLSDLLGLSQQQQEKVDDIMKSFREKMKVLRDEQDKQLQGVMTADQFEKFKQFRR